MIKNDEPIRSVRKKTKAMNKIKSFIRNKRLMNPLQVLHATEKGIDGLKMLLLDDLQESKVDLESIDWISVEQELQSLGIDKFAQITVNSPQKAKHFDFLPEDIAKSPTIIPQDEHSDIVEDYSDDDEFNIPVALNNMNLLSPNKSLKQSKYSQLFGRITSPMLNAIRWDESIVETKHTPPLLESTVNIQNRFLAIFWCCTFKEDENISVNLFTKLLIDYIQKQFSNYLSISELSLLLQPSTFKLLMKALDFDCSGLINPLKLNALSIRFPVDAKLEVVLHGLLDLSGSIQIVPNVDDIESLIVTSYVKQWSTILSTCLKTPKLYCIQTKMQSGTSTAVKWSMKLMETTMMDKSSKSTMITARVNLLYFDIRGCCTLGEVLWAIKFQLGIEGWNPTDIMLSFSSFLLSLSNSNKSLRGLIVFDHSSFDISEAIFGCLPEVKDSFSVIVIEALGRLHDECLNNQISIHSIVLSELEKDDNFSITHAHLTSSKDNLKHSPQAVENLISFLKSAIHDEPSSTSDIPCNLLKAACYWPKDWLSKFSKSKFFSSDCSGCLESGKVNLNFFRDSCLINASMLLYPLICISSCKSHVGVVNWFSKSLLLELLSNDPKSKFRWGSRGENLIKIPQQIIDRLCELKILDFKVSCDYDFYRFALQVNVDEESQSAHAEAVSKQWCVLVRHVLLHCSEITRINIVSFLRDIDPLQRYYFNSKDDVKSDVIIPMVQYASFVRLFAKCFVSGSYIKFSKDIKNAFMKELTNGFLESFLIVLVQIFEPQDIIDSLINMLDVCQLNPVYCSIIRLSLVKCYIRVHRFEEAEETLLKIHSSPEQYLNIPDSDVKLLMIRRSYLTLICLYFSRLKERNSVVQSKVFYDELDDKNVVTDPFVVSSKAMMLDVNEIIVKNHIAGVVDHFSDAMLRFQVQLLLLQSDYDIAKILSVRWRKSMHLFLQTQTVIRCMISSATLQPLTASFRSTCISHSKILKSIEQVLSGFDHICRLIDLPIINGKLGNFESLYNNASSLSEPFKLAVAQHVLIRYADILFGLRRYGDAIQLYALSIRLFQSKQEYRDVRLLSDIYMMSLLGLGQASCKIFEESFMSLAQSDRESEELSVLSKSMNQIAASLFGKAYELICGYGRSNQGITYLFHDIVLVLVDKLCDCSRPAYAEKLLRMNLTQLLLTYHLTSIGKTCLQNYYTSYIRRILSICLDQNGPSSAIIELNDFQSHLFKMMRSQQRYGGRSHLSVGMLLLESVDFHLRVLKQERDVDDLDYQNVVSVGIACDESVYNYLMSLLSEALVIFKQYYARWKSDALIHGISSIYRLKSRLHMTTLRPFENQTKTYVSKALNAIQMTLSLYRNLGGVGKVQELADTHVDLGHILVAQHEFSAAIDAFTIACDIYIEAVGENSISVAHCYTYRAKASQALELFEQSEEDLFQAISTFESQLDVPLKAVGNCKILHGFALQSLQEFDNARSVYIQAFQIFSKLLGKQGSKNSRIMANILNNLGIVNFALNDFTQARDMFNASMLIIVNRKEEISLLMLDVLRNLEVLCRKESDEDSMMFFSKKIHDISILLEEDIQIRNKKKQSESQITPDRNLIRDNLNSSRRDINVDIPDIEAHVGKQTDSRKQNSLAQENESKQCNIM